MTTKTKATETGTGPLFVNSLKLENFLRIEGARIEPKGNHVKIHGPNGSGKTTVVSALWWALQGADSKRWPEPLHKGAEKGSVTIELADRQGNIAFIVTRKVTEEAETLIVKAADGSKVKSPAELLKSLISSYCLDPIKFIRLRPIEQLDQLIAIMGIEPPTEKVELITGRKFPALPQESAHAYLQRLSGDDRGILYVERRDIGRTVVEKKAALDEELASLEAVGGRIGPEEKEGSAADIHREIDKLLGEEAKRAEAVQKAVEARQEHKANTDKMIAVKRDFDRSKQVIEDLDRQISELQKKRADEAEKAAQLETKIKKGSLILAELDEDADELEKAVLAMTDNKPAIADLRQKALEVESTNKGRIKRQLKAESVDKLTDDLKEAERQHGLAENALESVRQLRQHLLDGIDIGIKGLEVGIGEIRLGGVPFSQASQAQQITVACVLGMRQDPRLRLLTADDGEHLDKNSRETLFRIASENNFEVIFTSVSDEEALAFEIYNRPTLAA